MGASVVCEFRCQKLFMNTPDLIAFTTRTVTAHRMRAGLTALGIAIGVAAVVLLTSIGAGIHKFVLEQFNQFGTNLISIQPGKTQTMGGSLGMLGNVRPLSIDDAVALERAPHVVFSNPMMQGSAEIEHSERKRRATVYAVGAHFHEEFRLPVEQGTFLPEDDPRTPRALVVLGHKMYRELFGASNALGETIRVSGQRFRIIGVMKEKGTTLGMDLDDTVYIPAAKGLELFNRVGLLEIEVSYREGAPEREVEDGIKRILHARHGEEDITITNQQQMLDTLGSVLSVLTFAVGALGSISLLVGGVGIFTIMTIGVRERTPEVGLLLALGAVKQQILKMFLMEAMVLSAIGGVAGLVFGLSIVATIDIAVPSLPVSYSPFFILLSEFVAVAIGLLAGILPAIRAAQLEPVEALRTE
jgi:putative ABC transport system permease protein